MSGVPLYFTVCASNTEGRVACTNCGIPTYDMSLPSGRVTPDFQFSSHPNILKGSALAVDDSQITDKMVSQFRVCIISL